MVLRHAIFVGRQYSLEECIWLVLDCDLVVEVKGVCEDQCTAVEISEQGVCQENGRLNGAGRALG